MAAESHREETKSRLLFRLYMPEAKLRSVEAAKFPQFFQHYLSHAERLSVSMDWKRTDHGIIYEFHAQTTSVDQDCENDFQDFSMLIELVRRK